MRFWTGFLAIATIFPAAAFAQSADAVCPRHAIGSTVQEPPTLRSHDGKLEADLYARDALEPGGSLRYCFVDGEGNESPTLRVRPGDTVILRLHNQLRKDKAATAALSAAATRSADVMPMPMHHDSATACTAGDMVPLATNLHFHGLTIPPVCHQDDVMHTTVLPGDAAFEYKFQVPDDEPPGLYWYHPHIHGSTKVPVLGGASGAIIVEGIERADVSLAGLPERTIVIRDRDLLNPNAPPSKSEPVIPKMLIDRDGDAANSGTGFGKPAKDLTINYVPVPYPDYSPATIELRAGEKQLWRVLNASAITYLDLQVRFGRSASPLNLISLDGVPRRDTSAADASMQTHLGLPPGARAEFVVNVPDTPQSGLLVTRFVDTGAGGENDPNRALAHLLVSPNAPEPPTHLAKSPLPLPAAKQVWLGNVQPVRVRKFFFSEKLADPNDPTSAIEFYLTPEGGTPKMFDMNDPPDVVAEQGTVEDWIIENRSNELHAFHIHQLHFLLLEYNGRPVSEDFLRDTVNVSYSNGHTLAYPSVRIRMDFRDRNTIGTFPYHCHVLEHEDKGMMGLIQVVPPASARR